MIDTTAAHDRRGGGEGARAWRRPAGGDGPPNASSGRLGRALWPRTLAAASGRALRPSPPADHVRRSPRTTPDPAPSGAGRARRPSRGRAIPPRRRSRGRGRGRIHRRRLARRRVVAAGRLVADAVGRHPVGIDVAAGQRGAGLRVGQRHCSSSRARPGTRRGSVRRERQRRRHADNGIRPGTAGARRGLARPDEGRGAAAAAAGFRAAPGSRRRSTRRLPRRRPAVFDPVLAASSGPPGGGRLPLG